MTGDWLLLGEKLRACRKSKGLTLTKLARKSGYSERTHRRYESASPHVTTEVVETLATALGVPADTFARAAVTVRDSRLPALTRLRQLVTWEIARKPAPPVVVDGKSHARFGAKSLQDVNTAWRVHEGATFAVVGELRDQRNLSAEEAKLLDCARGTGACFHLFVAIVPNEALGVTVHSRRTDDTRRLQKLLHREVTLIARVVVAPAEPSDDGHGFAFFISDSESARHAWTLVVESVVTDDP